MRAATTKRLALLAEFDTRRLYLGESCSSLFTYCTHVQHLSEHAAHNRIDSARAVLRFPVILDLIEAGALTLTNVRLLAPHLTDANHCDVLERARHKMKRDVELLIATIHPSADAPSVVRKLPTPRAKSGTSNQPCVLVRHDGAVSAPDAQPSSPIAEPVRGLPAASVKPLTPERYKIQVTASSETYDRLRRAQDLLRHSIPNADPAEIITRALELLVKDLERKSDRLVPGASCILWPRQVPVALKWQCSPSRHHVIGKICDPFAPRSVICIKRQIQPNVLIAPSANDVDVPRAVVEHIGNLLAQRFVPEVRVQLTIAQVIGLADKDAQTNETVNDLPQF
jgi:hypothetical protein